MKRIIPFLATALMSLAITEVHAQAQPFGIVSAADSTFGPLCTTPASIDFFIYGWANQFNAQTETVTCAFHYGDGTSDTVTAQLWGDFAGLNFFAYGAHQYTAPGSYTVYYEAWGTASGSFYYDSLIVADEIVISDTCGTIEGTVWYDADNNCQIGVSEPMMESRPIGLFNVGGTQPIAYDYTDANGAYGFYAPMGGNYEVHLLDQSYNNACPGFVQPVGTMPNSGIDFGVFCDSTYFDLAGSLSAWQIRPGFNGNLYLYINNLGCLPQSGTATITLDPVVSYNGTCFPQGAITASGNTLTFNFAAISSGQWGSWVHIGVYTDPGAILNTTACFNLSVTPTNGDADLTNNSGTFCFPVTNSWDPNDKAVTPGTGANGGVLPNQDLTYRVRFQNTGTAEAVNVFILDTIDTDLDLSTFRVLAASHTMQVYMLEDRVVKFSFPDINLPDSTSDEVGSHGFVLYTIAQNADLPEGTVMENTAHIFFDFNPAVVTNTTLSTIDLSSSISEGEQLTLDIRPNPVKDVLTIAGHNGMADAQVIDAVGRTVLSRQIASDRTQMDVSSLKAGAYIIRITDFDGVHTARFVKD